MYTCDKCGNRLLDDETEVCADCRDDEWEEGYEGKTTII